MQGAGAMVHGRRPRGIARGNSRRAGAGRGFASMRCMAQSAVALNRWCSTGACHQANLTACAHLSWAGRFRFRSSTDIRLSARVADGIDRGRTVFTLFRTSPCLRSRRPRRLLCLTHVPPQRAILAANMETALNACGMAHRDRRTGLQWSARASSARSSHICAGELPGTQVTLVDIDPARERPCRQARRRFCRAERCTAGLRHRFSLPAAPAQDLQLRSILQAMKQKSSRLSWYGDGDVALPLGGAFHSRRLTILSSQVGKVAPSHRPRWPYARRLAAALDLLGDERLDALIAPPIAIY